MKTLVFLSSIMFTLTSSNEELPTSACYCLARELSSLRNPVHIETIKGSNSYMIAEQVGLIHKYYPDKPKDQKLKLYLDITDKVVCEPKLFEERGLLGFALHPKFNSNKKMFLYTVRKYSGTDHVVVSEITDSDVQQEKVMLVIKQPGNKRNGGQLLFGPDGFLYIFVGDGGPEVDLNSEAQNGENLLGKILRIDVDQTVVRDFRLQYYGIPDSNPVRAGWRPEIFAMGIRHMWRCGLDKGDKQGEGRGRIFCGELGSHGNDEINLIQKGGNYGWPYMAGNTCVDESKCSSIENEVKPISVFNHTMTPTVNAIVGGPVYRGKAFSGIDGHLLFGDFVTADLFTLQQKANKDWDSATRLTPCDHQLCGCDARDYRSTYLISFGQTGNDELMLLMTDDLNPANPRGSLLRMVPPQSSKPVQCGAACLHENHFLLLCLANVVIFIINRPYS